MIFFHDIMESRHVFTDDDLSTIIDDLSTINNDGFIVGIDTGVFVITSVYVVNGMSVAYKSGANFQEIILCYRIFIFFVYI